MESMEDTEHSLHIYIKENSWLARIAAYNLKAKNMAITFGNTIHLYKADYLCLANNKRWLRHELQHVRQYQRLGFIGFIIKYVILSIRYGYYNNPLEIEARNMEQSPIREKVIIHHYVK